jgi:hypothetical protein
MLTGTYPEVTPGELMRIAADTHFVELRITDVLSSGLPRAGDIRMEFAAAIHGFTSSGNCWVSAEEFEVFAAAVRRLNSAFHGRAKLASLSPSELFLSLSPSNSRGYVLVSFSASKSHPFSCSMSGEFEV